jgi:isopentenyldiphosphate isomerase
MAPDLKEYDEEQVRLMEEMCILVDENDKCIGAESKKTCKFIMFIYFFFTEKLMLLKKKRSSH